MQNRKRTRPEGGPTLPSSSSPSSSSLRTPRALSSRPLNTTRAPLHKPSPTPLHHHHHNNNEHTNKTGSASQRGSAAGSAMLKNQATWRAKRAALEHDVHTLSAHLKRLTRERRDVEDAVEEMLIQQESHRSRIEAQRAQLHAQHEKNLVQLQNRRAACVEKESTLLQKVESLHRHALTLQEQQRTTQEGMVVTQEEREMLHAQLSSAQDAAREAQQRLEVLQAEEERMKDASYGLTGEVKEMVEEMAELTERTKRAAVAAMEVEVERRALYSICEELKGSIRVYCRLRGLPGPASRHHHNNHNEEEDEEEEEEEGCGKGGMASAPSTARSSMVEGPTATDAGEIFELADYIGGEDDDCMNNNNNNNNNNNDGLAAQQTPNAVSRSLRVHQTRANATSTGTSATTESFHYDRVFGLSATQADVYHDVEPLVRNAMDGYRICIFAYGQTGSGKTHTMEGQLAQTATHGVTPRALQTIFDRQAELAKEGWHYELSCNFVEIYNDVIRDLFQSASKYKNNSSTSGLQHAIRHDGEETTTITNAVEKQITSMEQFYTLYRHAVHQRRTAKTELNQTSSRSHCIFLLYLHGVNATIRQKSEGVLCMVDLAGSERVLESGVQGAQLKEAININKSLLDLGKCIHALRCGAVVPWRNCKLTYLLQHYLGAKGGKMLMIVTVSNKKQHLAETLNSLRFAMRVQETVVGTSVKRVANF